MPINPLPKTNTVAFLLPHRDDEFGIFQQIQSHLRGQDEVKCIFFTQTPPQDYHLKRNAESRKVLTKIGVAPENILNMSYELDLYDLDLLNRVLPIAGWLEQFIAQNPRLTRIYVPAWEGGHPDHDILHGIIVKIMARHGRLNQIYQFPLYNNLNCPGQFFRVHSPLEANGTIEKLPIVWRDRIRFLYYCLLYPSQLKAFIGLYPFIFLHTVFYGVQYLQPVSVERIRQRPMAGVLYYEKRKFATYEAVAKALSILDKPIRDK